MVLKMQLRDVWLYRSHYNKQIKQSNLMYALVCPMPFTTKIELNVVFYNFVIHQNFDIQ